MNKETLYKVGVIASAVCIGLVAYQTGKPDEFYKRHEAYASERPNRFFWSVDRNYYVMDIPEGKENDEKWRSFMNWQERALTFDENAILLVGSSYQLGVPVGQNDDAAAYWFKLAADRFGNPDAMYNYAIIAADKGNRKTYTNYLIQAAEKGNTPAMNEIARSVLERRNQKDSVIYKEGRRYAEISASKKSPIGTLLFANYLYNERDKKAADVLARIRRKAGYGFYPVRHRPFFESRETIENWNRLGEIYRTGQSAMSCLNKISPASTVQTVAGSCHQI